MHAIRDYSMKNVTRFCVVSVLVMSATAAQAGLDGRVATIIQERAVDAVCNDKVFLDSAGISHSGCLILSNRAAEYCYRILDPYLPEYVLGQDHLSDESTKELLVGLPLLLAKCIQATVLLPDFSIISRPKKPENARRDPDSPSQTKSDSQHELGVWFRDLSWSEVQHFVQDQYRKNSDDIDAIVSAFLESDLIYLVKIGSGSVVVQTAESNGLHNIEPDEGSHWADMLAQVGARSISKTGTSIYLILEKPIVTDDHAFFIQYAFRDTESAKGCHSDFRDIECGLCEARVRSSVDIQFLWISNRVMNSYLASVKGSTRESKVAPEAYDEVASCWIEGMTEMGYTVSESDFPIATFLYD